MFFPYYRSNIWSKKFFCVDERRSHAGLKFYTKPGAYKPGMTINQELKFSTGLKTDKPRRLTLGILNVILRIEEVN